MHLTRGPQKARHRSRFNQLWAEVSKTLAKPWSLDDLCDYMGVGRAHLIRLCAEFYQTTPAAKVRSIKMEFAQSLLQNFEYPVAEIAEHIGYDSPSTFSTAFKKYFGYPPRERKQERTKGYSWKLPFPTIRKYAFFSNEACVKEAFWWFQSRSSAEKAKWTILSPGAQEEALPPFYRACPGVLIPFIF